MPRCHPTRRAALSAFIGSGGTLLGAPPPTSLVALAPRAAHAPGPPPPPPPALDHNGRAAPRLSPASRIRGQSNTLVMSGNLGGQTHVVNYNVDGQTGLVKDVWLLTAAEASRLWPTTPEEAAKWVFDPISQSWSKP